MLYFIKVLIFLKQEFYLRIHNSTDSLTFRALMSFFPHVSKSLSTKLLNRATIHDFQFSTVLRNKNATFTSYFHSMPHVDELSIWMYLIKESPDISNIGVSDKTISRCFLSDT